MIEQPFELVPGLSQDKHQLLLKGEITFHQVKRLSIKLDQLLTLNTHQLNCAGVTQADSAILALFIFALKRAREKNIKLTITEPTEAVMTLLNLYELQQLVET